MRTVISRTALAGRRTRHSLASPRSTSNSRWRPPLGHRLIEVAADQERHELHDPRVEYVAYVPPKSIARGKTLATRGIPGVIKSCTTCHGPQLRGIDLVPPIAGRSPSYLLRQLLGFATGARATPAGEPMRAVASALSLDDMIAAAAYAGSLAPLGRSQR